MKFVVQKGRVVVKARAPDPDMTATWSKVSGTIDLDPERPAGARGEVRLDMRSFEAGDWFARWQLKGDVDAERHPTATFMLMRLESLREASSGQLEGVALGQLQWRGMTVEVRARGKARVSPRQVDATGSFDVSLADLGVPAGDTFRVEVSLSATATA
jgi:polyisoprenoid-binding protein YceI